MAVLLTTDIAIAMYDSVTEQPLEGLRVFASLDHAEDFLRWLAQKAEAGEAPHRDPRELGLIDRRDFWDRWSEERVDQETGLLKEAVAS
jgi:hypothetical protein